MDPKPPKAASFDPGWNDPPPLTLSSQLNAAPKPRTNLNKRIAFPIQGNIPQQPLGHLPPTSPQYFPDNQSLPRIGESLPSQSQLASQATETSVCNENLSSSEMCTRVMDSLANILSDCGELGNKVNDIQKRINMLSSQWQNGQFNSELQQKIYELVEALDKRDLSQADVIHQCLVVTHIGSVGSWIPAVRQLIHHLRVKEDLLKIDASEEDDMY